MIDKKLNKEELLKLYNAAKDAYYNGEELMSDAEFDELESFLGLENKSYIGSKNSKKLNYTCQHAFIMGSLSKIQIKENLKTGEINWEEAAERISRFLNKASGTSTFETTPKLDGCSFSVEFINRNNKAVLKQCATRGDGTYGKDIRNWFETQLNTSYWKNIDAAVGALCENNSDEIFCIRGEILIPQATFGSEHSSTFTNPRSFVAGTIGTKWDDSDKNFQSNVGALHWVCYDYRIVDETGAFTELSWMNPNDSTYNQLKPFLGGIGELPDAEYCQVHEYSGDLSVDELKEIYFDYDDYRKNKTPYALDGVVFKPAASSRQYNDNKVRPDDCIAMKFMPMLEPTEIVDIVWDVKKTGEYFPTATLKPIVLDGKKITKASLHNYGYIVSQKAGIGAKVRVSLAGDIIPYIIEVVEPVDINQNNMNIPVDSYVETDSKSGAMHLMKEFTESGKLKNQFMASANTLNIPFVGPASASNLWDNLHDEFDNGLTNVLQLMRNDFNINTIYNVLGRSKSIQNIVDSLSKYKTQLTAEDVILSFCFKNCGHRAAALCAKILAGEQNYSTASMPAVAYQWALDSNNKQYKEVMDMLNALDIQLEPNTSNNDERIPIIMTGDPSKCTDYPTKAKWLEAHPQYVATTSWKECKILFTNDLESKTGKMAKAAKAGIPVKLYEGEQSMINKIARKVYEVINESFSPEHIEQENGLTPYDEELIDEASSTTYPDTIKRCIKQCDTLKAEYILRDMLQDLYDSGTADDTPNWSDNWGFSRRRYDD